MRRLILLIGGLATLLGGILIVQRATYGFCFVTTASQSSGLFTAFDVSTGARWNYRQTIRRSPVLREVSHNGQYVTYLKRKSVGSAQYDLFVDEVATDQHVFTVADAGYGSIDMIPQYQALWSPDDQYLAYQTITPVPTVITIFSRDGSRVWQSAEMLSGVLAWAPDSKTLAVEEFRRIDAITNDRNYIHFWTFLQGKDAAYLLSDNLVNDLYWSPRGGILAIESYQRNTVPPTPGTLTLMTASGTVLATNTPNINPYLMPWSPDGRYLYTPGGLFAFDGSHLTLLTDQLIGEGQWSPNNTLMAYRRNPDQTFDQVVYYPAEQRYQTRFANLFQPLVHTISQQYIDVKLRHDGSDWFVVMNADGSPLVKLPIASTLDYYGANDLGSSAIVVTEYTNTDSRSSPIYLTWIRSDKSLVRTLERDFQHTRTTWLNDHVLLYQDDRLGRAAIHGGLIDAENGQELMSVVANYLLQANVIGEQVTLLWRDDAGVFWFDKYLTDGTRVYHMRFDQNVSQVNLSPSGARFVLQTIKYDSVHNSSTTGAALVEVNTYDTVPLLADQIANIMTVVWKPDNSAVAISSQSWNDPPAINVFDANGHLLRHFANVGIDAGVNDKSQLRWIGCDQVTDPPAA